MAKFYPTRNDLDKPAKVERILKDIYERIYKPTSVKKTVTPTKRVDVNTGKDITESGE